VLKQLGENPTPAQILNLKVCDPAMGLEPSWSRLAASSETR